MKMNKIKKILENILKINREYILLFAVIGVLGALIYSQTAISQTGEDITITTFHPIPFGEFNETTASIFRAYNNPANFYIDPSGNSIIHSLRVVSGIVANNISGQAGVAGWTFDLISGDATLNNVQATTFYQAVAPPGDLTLNAVLPDGTLRSTMTGAGKYIYGPNDIAEGVIADGCEKGDVVLISYNDKADIIRSSVRFDARVAGVVSEDPSIYMGSGDNKSPLALAGVVKCKATTENGRIKRGDLLVSSSLPGHAMRAAPGQVKPGMLIGKAMQPLKDGTGKIYILLNKK